MTMQNQMKMKTLQHRIYLLIKLISNYMKELQQPKLIRSFDVIPLRINVNNQNHDKV